MKIFRDMIEINEELCNGCGQCILDCAEHALQIVDGKAKVISESLCDGLGACLQGCPQGALQIVTREVLPFDEEAVHALQKAQKSLGHTATKLGQDSPILTHLHPLDEPLHTGRCSSASKQAKQTWPIKLRLMPPTAPFLTNANILLVADCVPARHENFAKLQKNHVVLMTCPKFEDHNAILKKLSELVQNNTIQHIHTMRMSVPCCKRLHTLTKQCLLQNTQSVNIQTTYSIIDT